MRFLSSRRRRHADERPRQRNGDASGDDAKMQEEAWLGLAVDVTKHETHFRALAATQFAAFADCYTRVQRTVAHDRRRSS